MWCVHCQADVAAEVAPDSRHVRCASCGGEIETSLSERAESRTRHARELLERWSQERSRNPFESLAEPAGERESQPTALETVPFRPPSGQRSEDGDQRSVLRPSTSHSPEVSRDSAMGNGNTSPAAAVRRRFDEPHEAEGTGATDWKESPRRDSQGAGNSKTETGIARATASAGSESRDDRKQDVSNVGGSNSSGGAVPAPHAAFPAEAGAGAAQKAPRNWVAVAGQWLAYSGVLGLMAGTCLVILGYYRGPASYAPTGWLITMAGQMLLFLGVVTLVSNGMEETAKTVERHIGRLGERIVRLERAADEVRGPHLFRGAEGRSQGVSGEAVGSEKVKG